MLRTFGTVELILTYAGMVLTPVLAFRLFHQGLHGVYRRFFQYLLIDIVQATAKTIEALNKLSLPAGVDIKIKASTR